jgi:hypothetical protein
MNERKIIHGRLVSLLVPLSLSLSMHAASVLPLGGREFVTPFFYAPLSGRLRNVPVRAAGTSLTKSGVPSDIAAARGPLPVLREQGGGSQGVGKGVLAHGTI